MILYIYISKGKNTTIPRNYELLKWKFYKIQLIKRLPKMNWKFGAFGTQIKIELLMSSLHICKCRLCINDSNHFPFAKCITYYYKFYYHNCHVITKCHLINILSPPKHILLNKPKDTPIIFSGTRILIVLCKAKIKYIFDSVNS